MIKNIIFDFDGVILDSVPIKTEAYRILFKDYEDSLVEELIKYHETNGGISRYKKIEYFFNDLLKKSISKEEIQGFANEYSFITKEKLSDSKYLIEDSYNFIKENYNKYKMYIASGADETDLKYICNKLNIDKYFLGINGSPTIKNKIVNNIIFKNRLNLSETILIGDSITDYEAALENRIDFYGYNNKDLSEMNNYIDNFIKDFKNV